MKIEEAIKRYSNNAEYERTHGNLQGCLEFRQLADWLKELKQLREQTRWIPVSERLPEKPDNYPHCGIFRTYFLVSLASGCVKALGYEFDKDRWQITGSPVVAWMPLPTPYQSEIPTGAESEE